MSRVGLIGSNSVEFIDKLLSIWNNNDSAVLIDYDTPAKAAADILSEVGADFCYVEDTIKDKYGVMSSFLTLTGYSVHNKMPSTVKNQSCLFNVLDYS